MQVITVAATAAAVVAAAATAAAVTAVCVEPLMFFCCWCERTIYNSHASLSQCRRREP